MLIISLCLFTLFMPLESIDLFGLTGSFSIAKIAGLWLTLLCLLQPKLYFARPPQAFWGFIAYLLVSSITAVFYSAGYELECFFTLTTLAQHVLMFWLFYNLLKDRRLVNAMLISYSVGCIVFSCLMLSGITIVGAEVNNEGGRISALGENPNVIAYYISIGLIILIGLVIKQKIVKVKEMIILCPPVILILYAIIRTGSRGGMLCVGIAVMAFIFAGKGWRNILLIFFIVSGLLAIAVYKIQHSDIALSRWVITFKEGNVATRDEIMEQAFFMFTEKPILGWGPAVHLRKLGDRTARTGPKDTHNDLLWVMTSVGLVGTIPFFIAICFCVASAWRARKTIQGMLPMALITAVLIMSMSGTIQNRKITGLVLAYAAASATYSTERIKKREMGTWSNGNEIQRYQ